MWSLISPSLCEKMVAEPPTCPDCRKACNVNSLHPVYLKGSDSLNNEGNDIFRQTLKISADLADKDAIIKANEVEINRLKDINDELRKENDKLKGDQAGATDKIMQLVNDFQQKVITNCDEYRKLVKLVDSNKNQNSTLNVPKQNRGVSTKTVQAPRNADSVSSVQPMLTTANTANGLQQTSFVKVNSNIQPWPKPRRGAPRRNGNNMNANQNNNHNQQQQQSSPINYSSSNEYQSRGVSEYEQNLWSCYCNQTWVCDNCYY